MKMENDINTNDRLLLTHQNQTETEDKFQTEEDLSKYNDILKGYPKAKIYIRQISLIYPISKKTIEKLINARQTIEHHFADIYEQNIIYGINQCFRFNKSRPSPAQVIAMITGDSVAEQKQIEINKSNNEKTEYERYRKAKEKYETLRNEALENYKTNQSSASIRQRFKREAELNPRMYDSPIKVLDEIMADFISMQALILSYGLAGIKGFGIGISSHLAKISAKSKERLNGKPPRPPRLPDDCFTMYFRSKEFWDGVKKGGIVRTEIPTAFIEYIEDLIEMHKKWDRR